MGLSRDDPGVAPVPHAFTVPVDSVTLVHTGVPGALVRTLTSYVPEFLPGLKAMLEAETVFRGACTLRGAPPFVCEGTKFKSRLARKMIGKIQSRDHHWPETCASVTSMVIDFCIGHPSVSAAPPAGFSLVLN